ncbi:GDP-fucose protein O-fucosyltransferase 2 isoform X3 [Bacillus rossius redtenbacheri]|uniref:GDP-fucose protein O-fucosyltransferase 2 isoform X3 n=1 Tax=Bacillus rossius redtenbacheri TaxID=93214 RepID=UPI002FDD9DD2
MAVHLFAGECIVFAIWSYIIITVKADDFCQIPGEYSEQSSENVDCQTYSNYRFRYILYDVNPPEGFNLRRDVYMRIARFVRKLSGEDGSWKLVLPPWTKLYHWQSADVGKQSQLPWRLFFDVASLQKFAPVVEMDEFLKEYDSTTIDEVFVLQHYKDAFKTGKWEEKYEIQPCVDEPRYRERADGGAGGFSGWFWGLPDVTARRVRCLSFHGHASQLQDTVQLHPHARTIMFDHAEVALHDAFGDRLYWMARRSMRFAPALRRIAAEFREEHLNSTDEADGTVRPDDWTAETAVTGTKGGPYLAVHLRRKDFVWGRPKEVPSVIGAAAQIKAHLDKLEMCAVFIATDAPEEEFEELKSHLTGYKVFHYRPSSAVKKRHKDGGIAIIDQIICSHARFFVGTYESTFSFRIQEEREILGFPPETTFNRLCGDGQKTCSKPSVWRIVF